MKFETDLRMPQRAHYLKTQVSVPYSATKWAHQKYEKVLRAMAEHLKAAAGTLATDVEIRAVYNERTNPMGKLVWRDVLMVIGFNGPLTAAAKKMQADRAAFELKGGAGLSSTNKKIILA